MKKTKNRACRYLAVLLVLVLLLTGCGTTQPDAETETTEFSETEQVQETTKAAVDPDADEMALPISLADGQLVLDSIFQFTGFNPDCGGEEGENIAAVQLTNVSGRHLTQAELTMTLTDGTVLNFFMTDVPAGASVMALSVENAEMDPSAGCWEVSCEPVFEDTTPVMADELTIETEGTTVTVTNGSGRDLTNVIVYCHCLLGEDYFGGLTYSYTIDQLPAGESAVIEAWDCYLDGASVVRVSAEG